MPLFALEVNDDGDDDDCITVEDESEEASAVKVDSERIVDIVLGSDVIDDDESDDDVVDVTKTSRTPCTITVCVSCTVVSTVVDWSNDTVVVMLNYMEDVKIGT